MSFVPLKSNAYSDARSALIDNSQTLSIGEVIIPGVQDDTSVVLTAGGTDGAVLGVVVGFKDVAGHAIELDTVVAEADNVTDKKVKAIYIPSHLPIDYLTDLDAAAETTDNSGAFGNMTIDSTGLLADESTIAAFSTVEDMQLFSYGLTGKDTTQIECRLISTILGYDIA